MKKVRFYSLMRRDGKPAAILHEGYFDGVYYYYKNNEYLWHVIHPDNGLSIAHGHTRKEAAEKAHASDMAEKIKNAIALRGECLKITFDRAVEETQSRIEEITA